MFIRSEQTNKNSRTRALILGIAMFCHTPRPLSLSLWRKADWIGLEPSICDYFNASLPNLRPSIRLFHDDAAKVILMCSARANRTKKISFSFKLSPSTPTCKVSQERICFDACIIRIILLAHVTLGNGYLIVMPIEHPHARFIRNLVL